MRDFFFGQNFARRTKFRAADKISRSGQKSAARLNRRSVYRFQAYVSFPEVRNFSKIRGRFQSHSDTREVERRFRLRKG